MPRPPSERVEEGFRIWSTEGERNATKTAQLMGEPQATVSYWKRTYHWEERYLALMGQQSEVLAALARAEARAILPAAMQRMRAIVSDRKPALNAQGEQVGETWAAADRDAVQATKLLAQIGLDGGAGQDMTIIEAQAVLAPHALSASRQTMSPEEEAIASLEANVAAVNTRIPRGRRV